MENKSTLNKKSKATCNPIHVCQRLLSMGVVLECGWYSCVTLLKKIKISCFVRFGTLCMLHLLNADLFSGLTCTGLVHSVSSYVHQPYFIRKTYTPSFTIFLPSYSHRSLSLGPGWSREIASLGYLSTITRIHPHRLLGVSSVPGIHKTLKCPTSAIHPKKKTPLFQRIS